MTTQKTFASSTITGSAVTPRHSWPKALLALVCVVSLVSAAAAQTALIDGGAPVMQSPTVFLIFWLPSSFHYDSSSTASADTTFESLMSRFFTDVSGSTYLNILSQYPGTCGPPAVATQTPCLGGVSVGGTTVDTHAYPHAGTAADPLSDADMQTEVSSFITSKGLTPGFNDEFFVFLGAGVVTCTPDGMCDDSFPGFCAYHGSFTTTGTTGGTVIYGVMPNLNSLGGCTEGISSSPNQLAADREIIALSHEFSESVTDPIAGGWRASVTPFGEIGDNCNTTGKPVLGHIAANGSNITMNGNAYVLQTEWSNDDDACIVSFANNLAGTTVENTFVTGNDDLRGNSDLSALLQTQDGSSQGTIGKNSSQPGWDSSAPHVRVSSTGITSPLQQELLTLTSHNDFLQNNDHWNIQSIDLKLRNPNGSIICEEMQTGNPLANITDGSPATFPTPNCLPTPPPSEPVVCSVFDDGTTNVQGPSGAVFISGRTTNNEQGKACIPGGQFGVCRKWFGLCHTSNTNVAVSFEVFDDGAANATQGSQAVYIPKAGNQACIPDQTSTGTCRRWFGLGSAADGRKVHCEVFDDGGANPTNLSDAIYIPHPIPGPGKACIPDPTPTGLCRRWFGNCVAQ